MAQQAEGMSTILVVEDDPSVARLVSFVLTSEGYSVRTARDGLEGLHQLEREVADLVVLDLSLPNIDGRTFVKIIRNLGIACHVLILSAFGAAVAADELHADGALEKPFDPEELIAEADRILAEAPGSRNDARRLASN
jgi:DNA-binding response OmpR family regulator